MKSIAFFLIDGNNRGVGRYLNLISSLTQLLNFQYCYLKINSFWNPIPNVVVLIPWPGGRNITITTLVGILNSRDFQDDFTV